MAKKQEQYPCVSPERVAQLLSLGKAYSGYIEFRGGHQFFVEITPGDNLQINEHYTPQDTILSVYVANRVNPLITETEKHWSIEALQTLQTVNSAAGLTMGAVEHSGSKGTFRMTRQQGQLFSPRYYKNGWAGGTRGQIKTYKVTTTAGKIGKGCFVIGVAMDLILLRAGEQSVGKTAANITFATIGTFGGPAGLIISGIYFGLDLLGAFDGPTHINLPPRDPWEPPTIQADATRMEQAKPIEWPLKQPAPRYTPKEQPVFKQGYKK